MPKSPQHLIQRNQTWYVRMIIPEDVRGKFDGKREFIKSLRTKDLRVAKRLANEHIELWKTQIEQYRINSFDTKPNQIIDIRSDKEIVHIQRVTRNEYLEKQNNIKKEKRSSKRLNILASANLKILLNLLMFIILFITLFYGIKFFNHSSFIIHDSMKINWIHNLPNRIFNNKWSYLLPNKNDKNSIVVIDPSFNPKWFSIINGYEKNNEAIEIQFYFEYKCNDGDEIISDQKFTNGKSKKLVCVTDKVKNKTWMAHSFLSNKNQKRILGDLSDFHATIYLDNLERNLINTSL